MAVEIFTKSPRKNVPNVGIKLGAACIPSYLEMIKCCLHHYHSIGKILRCRKLVLGFWPQNVPRETSGYLVIIFYSSPLKNMLWVLIRIVLVRQF